MRTRALSPRQKGEPRLAINATAVLYFYLEDLERLLARELHDWRRKQQKGGRVQSAARARALKKPSQTRATTPRSSAAANNNSIL
jgi:hypothetical protein